MWQDLKLGFRSLLKRPGFATAAIATLALGTGAFTAIVSVAYGVSLRPLPYSIDRARAELDAVTARLAREFPASNGGWTVTTESLHDSIVGNFGRATWLLLAAMAMVLLVTCLNVGGLLVARAVGRMRETAVRATEGNFRQHDGRAAQRAVPPGLRVDGVPSPPFSVLGSRFSVLGSPVDC